MMNMYEAILSMLNKLGPSSIPSICGEMNKIPEFWQENEPIQPSQIKSIIYKKRDLFSYENDMVSLHPDKEFISLIVKIGACRGPWVKIDVDFMRNIFTYFEWNLDVPQNGNQLSLANENGFDKLAAGNIEDFKHQLYRLKIWEWDASYEQEGIILDGINWSTRLETKAKVYTSEGFEKFPPNWTNFCKSLTILTGVKMI